MSVSQPNSQPALEATDVSIFPEERDNIRSDVVVSANVMKYPDAKTQLRPSSTSVLMLATLSLDVNLFFSIRSTSLATLLLASLLM
jgi:hypothetical protein